MMPWAAFFTKKRTCPLCEDKFPTTETFHELRMSTADGVLELEICNRCSLLFDKFANARSGRKDETDDDSV